MGKHALEYDTYVNFLKKERARAWFQYDELRQRAEEVISVKSQKVVELGAQLAEAVEVLKEVVDAADGKGWEQLDPSFKKQRAALMKTRSE